MAQREAPPGATKPPLSCWRCRRCGRLLARLFLPPGSAVEVKCKGCGEMNTVLIDTEQVSA